MTRYVNLPPIRRLIQPDYGHLLCDCDLSGADAQVVAWEANDHDLKTAFRNGLDIHNHNGTTLFGDRYKPDLVRRKLTWRDEMKRGVHGTTYLSGVQNLSRTLGWSYSEVDSFQHGWFSHHPGIEDYHRRLEEDIRRSRKITNKFGYRIIYFDRPTNILPKAVAWVPQSTIAIVTRRGSRNIAKNLPWLQVLLQVHDSVIFQVPFQRVTQSNFMDIKRHLEIEIPYPDPLIIPWGLKTSKISWQDAKKTSWETLE